MHGSLKIIARHFVNNAQTITLLSLLVVALCIIFNNQICKVFSAKDISVHYNVIAGILSARQNFQQRIVARKTWMKEMKNFSSIAYFIIGKKACIVPPEDRLHPQSCKEWIVNNSALDSKTKYPLCTSSISACNVPSKIYPGFSFSVRHPVIIEHLGILASAMLMHSKVEVALLEGATKKTVVRAQFSALQQGQNLSGYLYRRVEAFVLPQGFEGIILIEGAIFASACAVTEWHDAGGVISFTKIYKNSEDSYSTLFTNDTTVAASLLFRIHEVPKLQIHLQSQDKRRKEWEKNISRDEQLIQTESEQWKDIIFIDAVDVYDNLATKLLEFYRWLAENEHFSYVLKTDDDSLMNIPLITKKIDQLGDNFWWSSFRKNWPVNYFGKWADHEYSSSVYPMFACGAGNVISQNLVLWLSENKNYLHPYKGEDVSVGIWLAALKPNYIDDELWACNKSCGRNSYNLAELELEEMIPAWKKYLSYGDLCHCSR